MCEQKSDHRRHGVDKWGVMLPPKCQTTKGGSVAHSLVMKKLALRIRQNTPF